MARMTLPINASQHQQFPSTLAFQLITVLYVPPENMMPGASNQPE